MTVACLLCGSEFTAYPCHVRRGEGKYCSRKCYGESQRGQSSYERTPEHKQRMSAVLKGRITNPDAIVAAAAARRGVPPSQRTREVARERWTGEGNPKYKDGRSTEHYASGWGRRIRDQVIARDEVCADCGEWDDRVKGMHVHHLDGSRDNHDLENLLLLCVACHVRRHAKYRKKAAT